MTTDLVRAPDGLDQAHRALGIFQALGRSQSLPKHISSPTDAAVLAAYGTALGLDPFVAVYTLHMVEGRPILSAQGMAALVLRSTLCEYWHPVESTPTRATIETKRRGSPAPVRLSYTEAEARTAGLWGRKGPWSAHPGAMLRARCTAALARMVYPDLLAGVYEEDEGREIAGEYRAPVQAQARVVAEAEPARHPQEYPALEAEVVDPGQVTPPAPRPLDREAFARATAPWGLDVEDALHLARAHGAASPDDVRAWWGWASGVLSEHLGPELAVTARSWSSDAEHRLQRRAAALGAPLTDAWACSCQAGQHRRACHHAAGAEVGLWLALLPEAAASTISGAMDQAAEEHTGTPAARSEHRLQVGLELLRSWRAAT